MSEEFAYRRVSLFSFARRHPSACAIHPGPTRRFPPDRPTEAPSARPMRDRDVVDFELRLFAVAQEHVAAPSIGPVDALLDGQQRAVAVVRERF